MADTVSQDVKLMLIRKQRCFSTLTDQELLDLSALFKESHVRAGEVIVKEGDPVDSIYLILTGKADVRRTDHMQAVPKVQPIAVLGPDNAIGLNESGFYSLTGLRTATVIAMTSMTLLRLSVPEYHGFSLVNSHVNEEMHKFASKLAGFNS